MQKKLNKVKREKELLEQQIDHDQRAQNELKLRKSTRQPLEPLTAGNMEECDDDDEDEVGIEDLAGVAILANEY